MEIVAHTPSPRMRPRLARSSQRRPTPSGPPDEALVAAALAGDRAAEETIYRRHAAYIGGMVVRLLGNRTEAEDVVQDTFLTGLRKLGQLRDHTLLRPWLARIAVRLVQRRVEARRRTGAAGSMDESGDDGATANLNLRLSAAADQDVRADLSRVVDILDTLAPSARLAWILHRVEGETLEVSARLCGCSLATVKRRIALADLELARGMGTAQAA